MAETTHAGRDRSRLGRVPAPRRREHDWPAWADMFTDDARYEEHYLGVFEGRAAIKDFIVDVHEGIPGDDALDRVVGHRRRPHRLLHLEQPARSRPEPGSATGSPTRRSCSTAATGSSRFEADYYNPADAERVFAEWLADGGRRDTPQDRSLQGIDGWTPTPPTPAVPARRGRGASSRSTAQRGLARGRDRRLGPVGRPVHRRRALPRAPLRLLHVGQPRSATGSSR